MTLLVSPCVALSSTLWVMVSPGAFVPSSSLSVTANLRGILAGGSVSGGAVILGSWIFGPWYSPQGIPSGIELFGTLTEFHFLLSLEANHERPVKGLTYMLSRWL